VDLSATPGNLRRTDIEAALRAMNSAGQSQRSIHQAAVVLNNTLAWARDQRIVAANPVTGCELPNGTSITAARHR
jgi:site-specific recombinase XerC